MNTLAIVAGTVLLLVVIALVTMLFARARRMYRRTRALRRLLDDADALEQDLRECRQRLQRAHAVMKVAPGIPAAGETEAQASVDAGLRSLLEHRLWIRDHAEDASQRELDTAVDALSEARAKLEPQIRALDRAQRDLDEAVRERIEKDAHS